MKKRLPVLSIALTLGAFPAWGQNTALKVTTSAFEDGKPIPEKYAYCTPDGKGRSKDGGNINPEISWSGAPAGTKSYVLIMVDPDVPASFDLANQPGKKIPEDFPRQNFYHWILTDIPATVTSIPEGKASTGMTVGGKPVGKTEFGVNRANDYKKVFKGTYGGYDGPCPPWNDERLHHYHFIVYALNTEELKVAENATIAEIQEIIERRLLAKGEIVGTYTDNQDLLGK